MKVAAMFEKAESANSLLFAWNGCFFMWSVYFCMDAYKRDVVVIIEMGAYIQGLLILCGAYYPNFMVLPVVEICTTDSAIYSLRSNYTPLTQ